MSKLSVRSLPLHDRHGTGSHALQERIFPAAAYLIFIGCCFYFLFHWFPKRDGAQARDFIVPYAGARCLWTGGNPYSSAQVHAAFSAAGGLPDDHPDWQWEPAVYPPSTLVELLPFSFLRYHTARIVWYTCNALSFCGAMLLVAHFIQFRYRSWSLLAGALTLTSEPVALLFNVAQPSGMAVGLAVLTLWLLLKKNSQIAAAACLALGLGLKPQLIGLIFIGLIFLSLPLRARFRAAALRSAVFALAILLVGICWLSVSSASHSWRQDYHAQVESSLQPGGINDPTISNDGSTQFTNLQVLFALIKDAPWFYHSAACGVVAVLLCFWIAGNARHVRHSENLWPCLAAIACIGLLPVYHRAYDCALLVVTFPSLTLLAVRRSWLALPAVACTGWLLMAAPRYHRWWLNHLSVPPGRESVLSAKMRLAIFQYPQPLLLLTLSCIYLVILYRVANDEPGADAVLVPIE